MPIVESGMAFGPYPAGHCFHIEKSTTYQKVQTGVRIAEFLLLRTKGLSINNLHNFYLSGIMV